MKKEIVTLIKPSLLIAGGVQTVRGVPSLGLAYLAGAVHKSGTEVKIIDGFVENDNKKTSFYNNEFFILGATNKEIISKIPKETLLPDFAT